MSKILVVDDEEFFHTFIRLSLRECGYELVFATSATAALNLMFSELPDLLILDMVMPGISGLDLCRLVRNNPQTQKLPILMLSGLDQPEEVRQAMQAGANAFLAKPATPDLLQRHVERLLSEHQSHQLDLSKS